MDVVWMRGKLQTYLEVCGRLRAHQRAMPGIEWDDECDKINQEAQLQLSTVEQIVRRATPEFTAPLMPPSHASYDGERFVRQALGALDDIDELAVRLAPDSPQFHASGLHPMIWEPASTIWATQEFKTAVQMAAVALSAHIKGRAGSNLNERKLVQQVFSPDPPKSGQIRLHLDGDANDETWQSRQQGLHLLAQGAFSGIRNVAAHDDAAWSEQVALEYLAVLSVVARWADETHIVSLSEGGSK